MDRQMIHFEGPDPEIQASLSTILSLSCSSADIVYRDLSFGLAWESLLLSPHQLFPRSISRFRVSASESSTCGAFWLPSGFSASAAFVHLKSSEIYREEA